MWTTIKENVIAYYPACGRDTYPIGLLHHARLNQWRRHELGNFPLITDWIYLDSSEEVGQYWWSVQPSEVLFEDNDSRLTVLGRTAIQLDLDGQLRHPLGLPAATPPHPRGTYPICHEEALRLDLQFEDLGIFEDQDEIQIAEDYCGHFKARLWFISGDSFWFAGQMAERQCYFTYLVSPCDGSRMGGNYAAHIDYLGQFFQASTLCAENPIEAYYFTDERRSFFPLHVRAFCNLDVNCIQRYHYAGDKQHTLLHKFTHLSQVPNSIRPPQD